MAGKGPRANLGQAAIIRKVDGKDTKVPVNIDKMLKTANLTDNVELQSGDILYIPAIGKRLMTLQDALGAANDWAALHEELRALRRDGDLDARRAARAASGVVKDERARHLERARRETRSARDVLRRHAAAAENKLRSAS